jgi:hypothetical protein
MIVRKEKQVSVLKQASRRIWSCFFDRSLSSYGEFVGEKVELGYWDLPREEIDERQFI